MTKIIVKKGDITVEKVDAIVNAANKSLLGGGGVDGAIHAAAGPELVAQCRTIGGCATGVAKMTKGYDLPAKHVIHTVGPVYGREQGREESLLQGCYRGSMKLAHRAGLKSIAFPCVSTGVYRYPKEEAARIAISEARKFAEENPEAFEEIRFIVFNDDNLEIYKKILN